MKSIAALVFQQFETLDLFGPLELFGGLQEEYKITIVAENAGLVKSQSGQRIAPDATFSESSAYDMVLVPGGPGVRIEHANSVMRDWLVEAASHAETVMSVCTGSALLATAGLLDGHRATTNKVAFDWVVQFGPAVKWVRKARWVEDGKFFTSSGVSAGMDMTLAVIASNHGRETAERVANDAEYIWNDDPSSDPFA